jgi:hypothetical protein
VKRSAKKNPDAESREDVASAGSLIVRNMCLRTHFQKATTDGRGPSLQIGCCAAEFRITALPHARRDGSHSTLLRDRTGSSCGTPSQRFDQRRVFCFGRAVSLLDRRSGNRKILAPPVRPESATCVPPREAARSRLSLTTTAGRRCLTDPLRERSTVSAIERCANPVPARRCPVNRRDAAQMKVDHEPQELCDRFDFQGKGTDFRLLLADLTVLTGRSDRER